MSLLDQNKKPTTLQPGDRMIYDLELKTVQFVRDGAGGGVEILFDSGDDKSRLYFSFPSWNSECEVMARLIASITPGVRSCVPYKAILGPRLAWSFI